MARRQETVQEESSLSRSEHDLALYDLLGRAGRNFNDVAGVKGREHTFTVDTHPDVPGSIESLTTDSTQSIRHQR
ncbi:MAG: hypothetical protein ABSD53_01800 [Terriglobales bacterium]